MNKQKIVIYVDDDEDDLEILKDLFAHTENAPSLQTFHSPEKALTYLREGTELQEKYCYLLVDINLRTISGVDFVKTVKKEALLKNAHVSLVTSSQSNREQILANDLDVALIIKPTTVEGLKVIMDRIMEHCKSLEKER